MYSAPSTLRVNSEGEGTLEHCIHLECNMATRQQFACSIDQFYSDADKIEQKEDCVSLKKLIYIKLCIFISTF